MARQRFNPRRVKVHRNYSVEELARLFGKHRNTVRNWVRRGLAPIDDRKPRLFLGAEVRRFLESERGRSKSPCPPGHLYCVRCREPKAPAMGMVEYIPHTPASGNLRGICPACENLIHRRVASSHLCVVAASLEVSFPQGHPRIGDREFPPVDCDFRGG